MHINQISNTMEKGATEKKIHSIIDLNFNGGGEGTEGLNT